MRAKNTEVEINTVADVERMLLEEAERAKQLKAEQRKKLLELKKLKKTLIAKEQAELAEKERKEETRRKILIGSCMLKLTENDQAAHEHLMMQLDKYLTENRDRVLFGLSEVANADI